MIMNRPSVISRQNHNNMLWLVVITYVFTFTALLSRLRVAQQERFHKKFKNFSNDGTPDSENSNASTTTSASTTYMRQQMRGFGIRGIQSLRKVTPSNYGFRKFYKPSTAPSMSIAPLQLLMNTNANNTQFTSGFQTPSSPATGSGGGTSMSKTVTYSNRMMAKMNKNREEIKRRYRDEFDSFVKSLISEVEKVAEVVSLPIRVTFYRILVAS